MRTLLLLALAAALVALVALAATDAASAFSLASLSADQRRALRGSEEGEAETDADAGEEASDAAAAEEEAPSDAPLTAACCDDSCASAICVPPWVSICLGCKSASMNRFEIKPGADFSPEVAAKYEALLAGSAQAGEEEEVAGDGTKSPTKKPSTKSPTKPKTKSPTKKPTTKTPTKQKTPSPTKQKTASPSGKGKTDCCGGKCKIDVCVPPWVSVCLGCGESEVSAEVAEVAEVAVAAETEAETKAETQAQAQDEDADSSAPVPYKNCCKDKCGKTGCVVEICVTGVVAICIPGKGHAALAQPNVGLPGLVVA